MYKQLKKKKKKSSPVKTFRIKKKKKKHTQKHINAKDENLKLENSITYKKTYKRR